MCEALEYSSEQGKHVLCSKRDYIQVYFNSEPWIQEHNKLNKAVNHGSRGSSQAAAEVSIFFFFLEVSILSFLFLVADFLILEGGGGRDVKRFLAENIHRLGVWVRQPQITLAAPN